jgi:hypothetical protein
MLEQSFGEAVGDFAVPPPHPRMAVYRNNIVSALINALRVRYPVAGTIAGSRNFAALAGTYALANLPSHPVLIHYGESFPAFIAASDAAAELPWLADVARLESLWWKAYHAAEATPLAAENLGALPPEQLFDLVVRFHPSASLMSSPYPAGSIWEACKQGGDWREPLGNGGEHLFIVRPRAEVHVSKIGETSSEFLSQLMAGKSLGLAYELAASAFPGFDLNQELALLIRSNTIIGTAQ